LAYGLAITTFNLSIDEDVFLAQGGEEAVWIPLGRFTVALVKLVLGDMIPLSFWDPALAVVVLIASCFIWAYAFNAASGEALTKHVGLVAFAVFYVTVPTNAYFMTFNTYNVEVSFGFAFAALAVLFTWQWGILDTGRLDLLLAIAFGTLAMGTYQSFVFACAAGVVAMMCVRLSVAPEPASVGPSLAGTARTLVKLSLPFVVALVLTGVIALSTVPSGGYVESFVLWGKLPLDYVVDHVVGTMTSFAAGSGFVGGWIATITIVVGLVVFTIFVRRAASGHHWAAPILVLALLVAPLGMTIMLGGTAPLRAQQTLPIAYGALWLLVPLAVRQSKAVDVTVSLATIGILVWNSGTTTRMFQAEAFAYQHDVVRATDVVDELVDLGWTGSELPIVMVGTAEPLNRPYMVHSETFGASFFAWRNPSLFLKTMGYPFSWPSQEQIDRAKTFAASMPVWPAKGSVALHDGIAIVKFSDSSSAQ
jgi:hypothetical protein